MLTDYEALTRSFTLTQAQLYRCFAADYSPATLIALLDTQLPGLYGQDGGVREGYTVAEHTMMVLRQFDKYYAPPPHSLPGKVDKRLFRVFLALHDIGKPIAITIDPQGKKQQHRYTWRLMFGFYQHLKIEERFIAISKALLYDDPIGGYLRNRRGRQETERLIRRQAAGTPLSLSEYFELLQIYYKVDAGGYTANAGGRPSLDALFEFDELTPQLHFAHDVQRQIDRLRL